jgi:hypothetical protein
VGYREHHEADIASRAVAESLEVDPRDKITNT